MPCPRNDPPAERGALLPEAPTNAFGPMETLKTFLEAFNRHDLDAIMAAIADDCVFDAPRGPHPLGRRYVVKEEVRKGLGARFTGIPDVHYGEDRHLVCGDRGVSEWLLTGTTTSGD